jgi:pimeloyl-ACP methyl ester carboxylesterase
MRWTETPALLNRARAERPVTIRTTGGDLNGIFTPPAPEASSVPLCVVLTARPRFSFRRETVELARCLATFGFACFRFDYLGWGDSEGQRPIIQLGEPYGRDIVTVIRFLRESLNQSRFVLWGRCFDGLCALSAFSEEGDAIEGIALIASPVSEFGLRSDTNKWRWVLDHERWRQVIFSPRHRDYAIRGLKGAVPHHLFRTNGRQPPIIEPSIEVNFQALVRSNARALFLYGNDDTEYRTFRTAESQLFGSLSPSSRSRFEIIIWPGRVHSVLDLDRQHEVLEKSSSWICGLHPDSERAYSDATARYADLQASS